MAAESSEKNGGKRIDRRVLKTRRAIMEAFERLVSQDDASKITVSAIAREADIDRKTFYLHYTCIDDLAHAIAEAGIERVLGVLQAQDPASTDAQRLHALLQEVNAILTSDYALYSKIASRLSTDQMLRYFDSATQPALSHMGIPFNLRSDEDFRRRLQFYLAGGWSLYAAWLTSPEPQPIEEVSQAIEEAIMGTPAILGSGDAPGPAGS